MDCYKDNYQLCNSWLQFFGIILKSGWGGDKEITSRKDGDMIVQDIMMHMEFRARGQTKNIYRTFS